MHFFIACILLYQFDWPWYWYAIALAVQGIHGYVDEKFHIWLRQGRFDPAAK